MTPKPEVKSFADMLRLGREYPCPDCHGRRVPCSTCRGYRVDPKFVKIPPPRRER